MTMKKIFKSGVPMVLGKTERIEDLFPPGFRYRMGGLIYIVKADVTQEVAAPMREVLLSDGSTEIIPVETILKDIREIQNSKNKANGEVMEPDSRYVVKTATSVKKKIINKKKTRKKNEWKDNVRNTF